MNCKFTKSHQHYRPSKSKKRKFNCNRFTSSIQTSKSYPTSFATMSHEQLSLCWDNFHLNMSSGINSLLVSEDLVDVTLAIDGQYLKAHKMILSVCSPYFKTLFSVNPCKHPIVFMKDISYSVMNDLLTFMYQGEVQVNQENLDMLIKTAEALEIKGLAGDIKNREDVIGVKSKRPIQQFKTKTIRKQSIPSPMKKTKLALPSVETETNVPVPIIPKILIKPEFVSTANLIKNCANLRMEAYDSTTKYQNNDFYENQVKRGLDMTENYDIEKEKEDKEVILPPSIDPTVEIKPEFVSTTGINNCINVKMESCDSSLEGEVNDNSFECGVITECIEEALDGSFIEGMEQTQAGTSENQEEWMIEKVTKQIELSASRSRTIVAGLLKLPGRKEKVCVVCSRKNGGPVRRSRTICNICKKGLHGLCISGHTC